MSEEVASRVSDTPAETKLAFRVEERIKQTITNMRGQWVRLAEDLFVFHEARMWHALGHPTFEAWAAGPDIDLQARWVYELISIWRELVIKRETDPKLLARVEPSKFQHLLPAVRRNQVTVAEALADAESLSRGDLRERYGDVKQAREPDQSTQVKPENESGYYQCSACGSWVRLQQ